MADFDKKLADALENDETFKLLMTQLQAAATSEVTQRVSEPCPKEGCSCKHIRMVKVPDYNIKLKIIEFLSNRGVGRPAAVETGADEEKINLIRHVCLCGKCECGK